MPLIQRFFLLLGSVATLAYFVSRIRKSKIKINHAIFWVVFGFVLMVLALVPGVVVRVSKALGFQSPANLVYLIIIFLLIVKLFVTTTRLSKMNEQIATLTQALALQQLETERTRSDQEKLENQPILGE